MTATVASLHRFPVKSMHGEQLEQVTLAPDQIFPGDRQYAVAHKTSAWDPVSPGWRPKNDFVNLAKVAKMANLGAALSADGVLEIARNGKRVTGGNPSTPAGRALIEQFLSAYLADDANGPFKLARADRNALTDVPVPFVSLINTESAADLERVTRAPVDPLRFRGNIVLRDQPAWSEFDWIGTEIMVGGVRLRVEERISRCPATGVNPDTAVRDMNIVRSLSEAWRHTDMGVYATVIDGGDIKVGDVIEKA